MVKIEIEISDFELDIILNAKKQSSDISDSVLTEIGDIVLSNIKL